jgi:hypothetical protein
VAERMHPTIKQVLLSCLRRKVFGEWLEHIAD